MQDHSDVSVKLGGLLDMQKNCVCLYIERGGACRELLWSIRIYLELCAKLSKL